MALNRYQHCKSVFTVYQGLYWYLSHGCKLKSLKNAMKVSLLLIILMLYGCGGYDPEEVTVCNTVDGRTVCTTEIKYFGER